MKSHLGFVPDIFSRPSRSLLPDFFHPALWPGARPVWPHWWAPWWLASLWVWLMRIFSRRSRGERRVMSGYYVTHSFSVLPLRVAVSLNGRSLFWSLGFPVSRSVNVLFLIPSCASGATGPMLLHTKYCTQNYGHEGLKNNSKDKS